MRNQGVLLSSDRGQLCELHAVKLKKCFTVSGFLPLTFCDRVFCFNLIMERFLPLARFVSSYIGQLLERILHRCFLHGTIQSGVYRCWC